MKMTGDRELSAGLVLWPELSKSDQARPGQGLAGLILSDGRIIHVKINQDIIHKLTLHFYQRHVIMWSILRLINNKEKVYKTVP